MKIPMVDLKRNYEPMKDEINSAVKRIFENSSFILGHEVEEFEKSFASLCGAAHAAGVASGTDALRLAILACGIKPGDEVITTPFTFIATSETISQSGAVPVFADIKENDYNIDPRDVERKITPKTKAVLCVHLYGKPADMPQILEIAGKNGLKVIEDCAQSFTAKMKINGEWKYSGTMGDCGTFSFFPAKNLGAFGDGGLVLSNDEEIIKEVRLLRNHGNSGTYVYEKEGFNSRLDALQAAILKIKLKYVEKWTAMRNEAAEKYGRFLDGICETPKAGKDILHSFNYYTVRFPSRKIRDKVREHLLARGIACQIYYPISLHLQKAYSHLRTPSLPVAERVQDTVLSLPMFPEISDGEIETVAGEIKEALK